MCGIIGWAGKRPKDFNKQKLDILGIQNETRGTDSCGLTIDGDIRIGIDKNKRYRDFIANADYAPPVEVPTVIGHTRKSSSGVINFENAHPFGFGQVGENSYEFVGVHNGTLHNKEELAKEFGVELKDDTRFKIDSEILLECIYKSGNFKVLSQYEGGAAIVFTNLNEPNVIYCFHGASKKAHDDKSSPIYIERPLFYYKESKNSLYISSIEESLRGIADKDKDNWEDDIDEFKTNVVYKITDGDIENAELFQVSRAKAFQKKNWLKKPHVPTITPSRSGTQAPNVERSARGSAAVGKNGNCKTLSLHNIYNERVNQNTKGGRVYMQNLRYKRNGHFINGCYTWIPNYGFYFLGETVRGAEDAFWRIVNMPFSFEEGIFLDYDKNQTQKELYVPFAHVVGEEITQPVIYYFYEGVRIANAIDFNAAVEMAKVGRGFDYIALSIAATHPIIDDTYQMRLDSSQKIMYKGELCNEIISPLGADNIYHVVEGNCVKIEPKRNYVDTSKAPKKTEDEKPSTNSTIEQVANALIAAEEDDKAKYDKQQLDKLISEIFSDLYISMPKSIKRLKAYSDKPEAMRAVALLESFLEKAGAQIK